MSGEMTSCHFIPDLLWPCLIVRSDQATPKIFILSPTRPISRGHAKKFFTDPWRVRSVGFSGPPAINAYVFVSQGLRLPKRAGEQKEQRGGWRWTRPGPTSYRTEYINILSAMVASAGIHYTKIRHGTTDDSRRKIALIFPTPASNISRHSDDNILTGWGGARSVLSALPFTRFMRWSARILRAVNLEKKLRQVLLWFREKQKLCEKCP